MTVTLPEAKRTRAPSLVGYSPPDCTITQPSLATSCTNWVTASIISFDGGLDFPSVCFTMDKKRIGILLFLIGFVCDGDLTCRSRRPVARLADAHLLEAVDRLALAEILELEQLADLDLAVLAVNRRIGKAPGPFHRLLAPLHLDDGVAGYQLLGLGE